MTFALKQRSLIKMLDSRNKSCHYSINTDWFLGFLEAEGTFLGDGCTPPAFECSQHTSDYYMMSALKDWIGAGTLSINNPPGGNRTAVYTLRGRDALECKLAPLFKKAPLTPKIEKQFLPWCSRYFPNSLPALSSQKISGCWLAGFADGDGSFYTTIRNQDDYRIGFQFQAVFDLSQKAERGSRNSLLKLIHQQYFPDWEKALIARVGLDGMDRLRLVSAPYLAQRCIPLFQGKLQSRKEIQLALFQEAVDFILAGQHLLVKNKRKIREFTKRCEWIQDRHSRKCQAEVNRILLNRRLRASGGKNSVGSPS